MTTQETAARYQELASQRKFIEIQDSLYHEDVVCQESEKAASMGMAVFTNGLEAVKAKGIARRATIETDEPGSSVSATIRRFAASDQCRRCGLSLFRLVSTKAVVDTSVADAMHHHRADQRSAAGVSHRALTLQIPLRD